tara:strand:- start:518 stop:1738 length:1221 start_codon:yes stop_codon:yes gene_type:complete
LAGPFTQQDPDELRYYREQASPFSFLYDMVRENDAELSASGRKPILGGLFSKEPVYGVDTVQYEGISNMLAGLLAPVARAIDAPYSASQGRIPSEDLATEAMNMAGMTLGAGALSSGKGGLSYNPNQMQVFAGPASKTADLDALKQARELSARMRSPEEIIEKTGWFKGADGKWRYEIDDSSAKIYRDGKNSSVIGSERATGPYGDPLGMVIDHPQLMAAYPDLENVLTKTDFHDYPSGHWSPGADTKRGGLLSANDEIKAQGITENEVLNVLLHEIDHAVQTKEGFSQGSSPSSALTDLLSERNAKLNDLSKAIETRQSELGLSGYQPKTDDLYLQDLYKKYNSSVGRAISDDEKYERYRRAGGEVSARNVMARQDMRADERISNPPWATEDTPPSLQYHQGLLK